MQLVNFQAPIRRNAPLNKGLLRWWRAEPKRNASPRLRDLTSKSPMTLSGALRLGQRGLTGAAGAAVFNGTSDYGQTGTIDLSSLTTLTVSFWLYWNAFANDNDTAIESSANPGDIANPGAISMLPNFSTGVFAFRVITAAAFNSYSIVRPSAAVWHHYVVCYDRNGGAQQVTAVYVDGVSQSLTAIVSDTGNTGGFGNYVWNFMARNGGASLQGAGRLDDIRIYNRILPAWEVRALLHASRRGYPNELRWSRGAEFSTSVDAVDPYIPYSVPYHRRSFKAMAPIKNAGHAMGTLSSAVPLTTIPGNAQRARVVGASGSATVYFREDEGTPSATNGTPIGAGGYADIVGRNNLEGFRAIEASPTGALWVEYFDSVE